jgi:hypothetical protein
MPGAGRTFPAPFPSSSPRRWRRAQPAQGPAVSLVVSPQVGQAFQNDGSGRVQIAHSGSSALPPRTGRSWPQPAQWAQRFWQARHHGSPVALAISAAAKRPQIEHVMSVAGRQLSQRGPSALRVLTRRRRPQPTQTSWLAGS